MSGKLCGAKLIALLSRGRASGRQPQRVAANAKRQKQHLARSDTPFAAQYNGCVPALTGLLRPKRFSKTVKHPACRKKKPDKIGLLLNGGDEETRTPDPLHAKQFHGDRREVGALPSLPGKDDFERVSVAITCFEIAHNHPSISTPSGVTLGVNC
jgi:hypothetical protein